MTGMIESGMITFGKIIIGGITTSTAACVTYGAVIATKTATKQDITNMMIYTLKDIKNTVVGICIGGVILVPLVAMAMVLVDSGVTF